MDQEEGPAAGAAVVDVGVGAGTGVMGADRPLGEVGGWWWKHFEVWMEVMWMEVMWV